MSDAPEKIWAWVDYDGNWDGTWLANSECLQPERLPDAEYIRADLHEALKAELQEARMQSLSVLGRRIDAALAALKGQADE